MPIQTPYAFPASSGVSLSGANTWTGAQTINNSSDVVALTILGASGQTNHLLDVKRSDGAYAMWVDSPSLRSYMYELIVNARMTCSEVATLAFAAYKGIVTAGYGVPVIYASGRVTAQTGAASSIATYTPTADGTFEVSGNILVTTATLHAFTMTCTYTDEGNTSRTLTMPFTLLAGSALTTSIANANGAVPYHGVPVKIRAKANTAITIQTTGTFTTVTYNAEADIRQVR